MTDSSLRCEIFCAVVDNYGDAGVCWRLARQLAHEYRWRVRLWIDDPHALQRLAPDSDRVDIRHWRTDAIFDDDGDIVIEAFACELPMQQRHAMARRMPPPLWINLEYLSAEEWTLACHKLPSPHPPLAKYFYFPGFDPASGGVLCENDYAARRAAFDPVAFRREFGLPPPAQALTISLFAYANPALPELLRQWADAPYPVHLLQPGVDAPFAAHGALRCYALPFLPQRRYDELLWVCDVNFVRGEDSFVRAQWAEKPMVWQIYPQADDTHWDKLDAFLRLYAKVGAGETALAGFWRAWNGRGALDWASFYAALPRQAQHARDWAKSLHAQPNLARRLVEFCHERLK